jgi:hypothetical protein
MNNIIDKIVISTVLLLLIIFIGLCISKLHIFFNSYNYLSKKINTGNSSIANMSFYKFYYNKKYGIYGVVIERFITFILILLTILAYIGFVINNNINFGYLNYYYGDIDEYSAINNFIILIIILCVIYCSSYLYWIINDKDYDDKLIMNENNLRKFIIDNIDYKYLDNYTFSDGKILTDDVIIDKYISNLTQETIGGNPSKFLFNLCFTYHLMTNPKFRYISDDIKKIYDHKNFNNVSDTEKFDKINESLNNIDIIANYDHNNNIALPKLYIMINDIKQRVKTIKSKNPNIDNILNIEKILEDDKGNNITALYNEIKKYFTNTIESFKAIYDKYYRYYMISILITNIIISYSILIFIYLIVKIGSSIMNNEKSKYYVYGYKSIYNSYIFYILLIYYFITSPIIIFSI